MLSDEELMHTGPDAMREYCKSLTSSLRDATQTIEWQESQMAIEREHAKALRRAVILKQRQFLEGLSKHESVFIRDTMKATAYLEDDE